MDSLVSSVSPSNGASNGSEQLKSWIQGCDGDYSFTSDELIIGD
jgi:hypothetical protein